MESTRKFLYYILSQYPNRPYGSKNEELVIGSIKNELHKTCDIVEEYPIKICPYLSSFQWIIISLYFALIMIIGLLHPLTLCIISLIGTFAHFLLFDLKVSWISSLLPGIQTTQLYGQINCIDHQHCFNEKTILFVSHIDNCYKEKGIISQIVSIGITVSIYVICILSCIGYFYGNMTGNYLFSPFISILSVIFIICSLLLHGKGKVNKISGLTTTSCLLQLSSYFKQNDKSLLKTTNIAFLILPIHSDRSEGILPFIKKFSQKQKEQLENTIVICLDELDDPETLTCYRKEGILSRKYSDIIINSLQDISQQENIYLMNKTKILQSTYSIGKLFRRYFKEVVVIDAKCHPIKQLLREEKEMKVKKDEEDICIHDDQIVCVNQCLDLFKKYIESIDFVIEMKHISIDDETIIDPIELEMNSFDTISENKKDIPPIDTSSHDKIDIQSLETLQIDSSGDSGENSIEL